MKFHRLGLLCTFMIIGWSIPALSQPFRLNVTSLSSSNSLSQNTILCIFKDKNGFMWFGTQDGLNKFDGFTFTVYKHLSSKPSSLPANTVNAVSDDGNGNMWVGTRVGGLSRYDRSKDAFTNFKNDPKNRYSISNDNINVIYSDKSSNLWIGTENGLNCYDKGTGRFSRYFHDPRAPASLGNSNIISIYEDTRHRLWIGTAGGLNLFDRTTRKCSRIDDRNNPEYKSEMVFAITEDEQQGIWIGTNKGLKLLDKGKNSLWSYRIDRDRNSDGDFNPVYSLAKTQGNRFWIGSNTTLQLFDAAQRKVIPITDKTDSESRLPNDGIYSLLEDKSGILWIGTSSEGVSKFDKNVAIFPAYKASLTNTPGAKNIVRGIAEDKAGNLYLATDVGLEYFRRSSNTYVSYRHNAKNKNSLISNYTSAILISRKDEAVWIGTYLNGLDRFDPKTGNFRHYRKGKGSGDLSSNTIYALLEDRAGGIWIGTDQGGLDRFDPVTGTFTKYLQDPKKPNGICDNSIHALLQDKNDNIWIGGYSNGISIFNPATKSFSQLNIGNSNLNSNVISAFYEDKKNNMWIGTGEGGLNIFNSLTHKITAFTEQNGLVNNTVNYITQDAGGYIWATTLKGITRLDPAGKQFKNYSYDNGVKSLEFNLGCGTRLKSGEIAAGSINGFNIIDPGKLNHNLNKSPVVITGFALFNKTSVAGDLNSPLKQNIEMTKELALTYLQSVFTITYAALDYSIPEENQYAYKLEGFDNEWRFVGNQRNATYTNLNPGTYFFKIKAANNDGVWNKNVTILKIIIVPPYWMTWWFRTMGVLLIGGGACAFYFYRINFVKRQKAALESLVEARTREIGQQATDLRKLNGQLRAQKETLQDQSEELMVQSEELMAQSQELREKTDTLEVLNQQLTDQKSQEHRARVLAETARTEADKANMTKGIFLATMSHEIRTPMNGVLGMASLLSETRLDIEQREYTDAILTSGESLLTVINDILDFSKIESGKLELDPQDFELRKCIEDVLEIFGGKAAETGIDLVYQIDDMTPTNVMADSLRLRQVLTNLVGNAIKFTPKGEVFIMVTSGQLDGEEFELYFEIRDTGIGIREDQLENLFKAFNQIDSSVTRKYGGTGLGLVICERLVALMGGKIKVSSAPASGSTFSFSIRCRKSPELLPQFVYKSDACKDKRVLVIDDNNTNLRIMQIQLKKWNMAVVAVSSGLEALDMLSGQEEIDLVITDMQMPDMDGVELSTRIKTIRKDVPIILLSSIGNESKKLWPHLFTSVLTKPVKQQQLFQVIATDLKKEPLTIPEAKQAVLSEQFALEYPFRILVAEDNLINQKLIIRVLNKLGYFPDLANDGLEVLNRLSKTDYDLVLMDIQMPNIDGLEATRLIRNQYGNRPLIAAMTANAMAEEVENCMNVGMDDYLSKPINLNLLINKLISLSGKLSRPDKNGSRSELKQK